MSEYSFNQVDEEEDGIDLTRLIYDFFKALKKTWIVVVACVVLVGGLFYVKERINYTPTYTADITVSITGDGLTMGGNADVSSAATIANVFPYAMSSGVLSAKIAQQMNMSYVPATVTASNIQGTNLLTLYAKASDPNSAYNVLQAVLACYDDITKYVVGNTKVEVYRDNGVPTRPDSASSPLGVAKKGAVIGGLLGLLATVVYMLMFRTISDSDDLQKLVSVRYLGTLPVYHKKKRSKGTGAINILHKNVQQNYMEAIRLIRTRVESRMIKKNAKVLMVTSSVPGEGKTTVSCNLASALAKAGYSVVLVDCDLRNPSIKEVLNIKGSFPGVEAMIKGEATYDEAAVSYEKKYDLKLRVIPGSDVLSDNSVVFGSERMKYLLEYLKTKADFVILDTPPAGLLVDSMHVVNQVDAVLYVVMCEYTKSNVVQRSIRELSDTGVEFLGVVLNGGKKASRSSGYGYKNYGTYGDTSRYGKADKEDDDE